MKTINNYIVEKLNINKSNLKSGPEYTLFPKHHYELVRIIRNEINRNGNECSLNHIDTSKIEDMSFLFSMDYNNGYKLHEFNGDISEWDVSNVKTMYAMFLNNKEFNNDISEWNVSNVKDMRYMFKTSYFNGDISEWDVSKVQSTEYMFKDSKFNQNISNWKIKNNCDTNEMFDRCSIEDKYKPKCLQ